MSDTQSAAITTTTTSDQQKQQGTELREIQPQTQDSSSKNSSLSSNSSSINSASNSISLIKLDELSSFGATKQSRLPALIKLNDEQLQRSILVGGDSRQPNSVPAMTDQSAEASAAVSGDQQKQGASLPAQVKLPSGKENQEEETSDDFHMVDMAQGADDSELMGPSLPQPTGESQLAADPFNRQQQNGAGSTGQRTVIEAAAALASSLQYDAHQLASVGGQQQSSHLGDSLIDMIINLRNENQNLVRALETNNDYVKERLSEFKRVQEEAKRREAQFALEKAEHEHQVRKLQRQNQVLSDRLKSMEAKLKDMKLEVSDSLAAAHSSRASSCRDADQSQLYPQLDQSGSFSNPALNQQPQATTMQMDATSGELYNDTDHLSAGDVRSPSAPPMDTDQTMAPEASATTTAKQVGSMSREELAKRFNADKAEFYAMDDPMKQCDKLEQQLNDIGKRDYEICLLQQQLNIYRQDFRLERMANLEAKIQIERLKCDIDRLCLERLSDATRGRRSSSEEQAEALAGSGQHRSSFRKHGGAAAAAAADAVLGKLGHQLSKKASKTAARAAKYAAKQAHREEKAAAKAAHYQQAAPSAPPAETEAGAESHQRGGHHRRGHHRGESGARHPPSGLRAVRSEVVNDLLSTANKAMLTGYKMASTHVNLALDKLSAFEQAQAANLAQNQPPQQAANKPMGPPSID